ncbi:hypothetical protein [Streptosporangium sp. NPDC002721]|uniref:hypothetical protein n=1 Tax=Streptosporangium sp. NPDC002721 TaxID=3366188 RepID=UPI00369B6B6A
MSEFGIAPGRNQYLVKADEPNWGVNYQAWGNYDYALMSTDRNNRGSWVVFHEKDGGYLIESIGSNWEGFRFWAAPRGDSPVLGGEGIWLSEEYRASVWQVRRAPVGAGFDLWTGDPNTPLNVCYRVVDNWLCAQNSLYGNVKQWISFLALDA